MALCAFLVQQSDGSYLLGVDPTNPNPATCAYVVGAPSESLAFQLNSLSPSDAITISVAIAGVWAIAAGFRLLGKQIDDTSVDDVS